MTIPKQPNEIIPCIWDASRELPSGQIFQGSSTIKITDESNVDVTGTMLVSQTISSTKIQAVIQGGTDGKKYNVAFRGITQNYTFEADITIDVAERAFQ